MIKTRFLYFVLASMLAFGAHSAHAEAPIDDRLKQAEERANKAQNLSKSALKKYKKTQKELVEIGKDMQQLEVAYLKGQDRLAVLKNKKAEAEAHLTTVQDISERAVRRAATASHIPVGLAFLSPPSHYNHHVTTTIATQSIMPHLQAQMKGVKDEIYTLETLNRSLKRQQQDIERTQSDLKARSKTLDGLVKKRESIYTRHNKAYEAEKQRVAKLAKEAKDLNALIANLKPSARSSSITRPNTRTAGAVAKPTPQPHVARSTVQSALMAPIPTDVLSDAKGRFYPVAGHVKVSYGQKDELEGVSKGLIFMTARSTTVIAPMDGKVVFAGAFQHFKQLLIIEHKGGYHSLVGGMDSISSPLGSQVKAGEPVGRVSKSETDHGRIYFELRKNGKPLNPNKVIKVANG